MSAHEPLGGGQTPLISVVVATWNSGRYLPAALESLLSQSYPQLEIIVVDDGSADATADVLAAYGRHIRVLTLPARQGAWHARNCGVSIARGELVAFQDADDLSMPSRFESQQRALAADPSLGAVFGGMEEFDDAGCSAGEPAAARRVVAGVCPGTLLAYRSFLDTVGEFPTRWQLAGFLHWYSRALEQRQGMRCLPDVVLRRRIHAANSGAGKGALLAREWLEALRERQRQRGAPLG